MTENMGHTSAGGRTGPATPGALRKSFRALDPRRLLGMLLLATRLGSAKARAALTFLLFLAVWLLLSIPDAIAATGTRASSFTYDPTSGLLLTETVEPNDAQLGVKTTYVYDAFGVSVR